MHYTKRCQVNISHYCYALSSLLAFKFEISMSLPRDIDLLASSIPSSGENKEQK